MKILLTALAIFGISVFAFAPTANVAGLEPFGKVELSGGAEKEQGAHAGGRGAIEALGVLPLIGNFGIQGTASYMGGLGSRFGVTAGPLVGWDGGKIGMLVSYQHRTLRDNDFVHLIPSVAFYLDQANLNLWYAQPVSHAQRDGNHTEWGINKAQATASFYAGSDWASFLRKDNVELTLGIQANSFAGGGNLRTGVGPVFGLSFLPMPGVGVNVVQGTFDSRSRYRVMSGLEFFFGRNTTTLKESRRKYLEPNQGLPLGVGSKHHRRRSSNGSFASDRNIKANVEPVNGRELLARLSAIPIQKWNYKAEDPTVRHIGPMAQDFHAAFNVGASDKTISIVDGNGIALASIQALYQMVQEKDQKIAALESRLAHLEDKGIASRARSTLDMLSGWPLIAMVGVAGLFIARRRKE
jgi:hypothetical protein